MECLWPSGTYVHMHSSFGPFINSLKCPLKWFETILVWSTQSGGLATQLTTAGDTFIGIGATAKAVHECLRWRGSGVPLWKLVPLSEGPWEEGNFWELDGLSFLGRIAVGLWFLGHFAAFLGTLCCMYCLSMPTSPLSILFSLTSLLDFLLLVFPSLGLVAWFPRHQVFCYSSSWMWIW